MEFKTVWQYGSSHLENGNHFETIRQWWTNLSGKEISWRQRLIPQSGDVSELDWEPQRFDEIFAISHPEIRGITLYWRKSDSSGDRNTTAHKLELDTLRQQLYIYPQSQKNLVIQVGLPKLIYQKIELNYPELDYTQKGENHILTLRDAQQQLEVKVIISPDRLDQLKQQLF